jgi:NAD(P)-dependent dehydrogenase (short-subunit alcohol dehydrogenase family)
LPGERQRGRDDARVDDTSPPQREPDRGIRVNGVAPGPIWTPLIPSTFSGKKLQEFGKKTPMGRAGQPAEVAPSYVFLASDDASYITGQIIHPNGGEVVNT